MTVETQQLPVGEAPTGEVDAPVLRTKPVRDALENLTALALAKKAAADEFAEAVESVALKSRIDKGVLASYVSAIAGDKATKKKAKAQQLALLFDEIGA
jgi:hypothetical protein